MKETQDVWSAAKAATWRGYSLIDALESLSQDTEKFGKCESARDLVRVRADMRERQRIEAEAVRKEAERKALRNARQLREAGDAIIKQARIPAKADSRKQFTERLP